MILSLQGKTRKIMLCSTYWFAAQITFHALSWYVFSSSLFHFTNGETEVQTVKRHAQIQDEVEVEFE